MRNKNGMLPRNCPSMKTEAPECWFDASLLYIYQTNKQTNKQKRVNLQSSKEDVIKLVTLISFKSDGIPAIPNSEAKETKTNTAATLVCK